MRNPYSKWKKERYAFDNLVSLSILWTNSIFKKNGSFGSQNAHSRKINQSVCFPILLHQRHNTRHHSPNQILNHHSPSLYHQF
ncbi:hypothetical protein HanIR_Chr03g0104531 [Helianthus annuus]|nr:hypothetical protein HanIR_Chr03g0104531 [Helianthus annuus]